MAENQKFALCVVGLAVILLLGWFGIAELSGRFLDCPEICDAQGVYIAERSRCVCNPPVLGLLKGP